MGLANTAGTTKEFIEAATKAASMTGGVSEGERHIILAMDAGLKNQPDAVLQQFTALVESFPNDERAQNLLANVYFTRQDYTAAIDHFVKATTINPSFSQPYNQLGYAYRFIGKYKRGREDVKKYTELIPDDPNPYDSYAELLMKRGRFDESIASYKKALSDRPELRRVPYRDWQRLPYMGRSDEARAEFAKIDKVARNTGEHRLSHFWMAASYVVDGATDKAVAEIKAQYALAEREHDGASMSGDLNLMGDILREAGRLDEVVGEVCRGGERHRQGGGSQGAQGRYPRNHVFEQGRLAVARNDLPTRRPRRRVRDPDSVRKVPFELRQMHELSGLVSLAEKQPAVAAEELKQSNQQDPRIIYLTSVAVQQAGDTQTAASLAAKAAKFNGWPSATATSRTRRRRQSAPELGSGFQPSDRADRRARAQRARRMHL